MIHDREDGGGIEAREEIGRCGLGFKNVRAYRTDGVVVLYCIVLYCIVNQVD